VCTHRHERRPGRAADKEQDVRIIAWTPALAFAALGLVTLDAQPSRDLGSETLAAGDGWASLGAGTTGGSAAAADQVYTVRTRRELVAALNDGIYPPASNTPSNAPKIIYVDGTIDANVDDDGQPLTCDDYAAAAGFVLEDFLAAFDPAVWGRVPPAGALETARIAARNTQQARVRIRVGSNTTIVGVGPRATIKGAWLDIRRHSTAGGNPTNIIIRNLTFQDTYDCFPAWSPTDGATRPPSPQSTRRKQLLRATVSCTIECCVGSGLSWPRSTVAT
jgi:pectate lyase